MASRTIPLAATLFFALTALASAQDFEEIPTPTLRPNVVVNGEFVRIGDLIDNAGSAAQIAVFRAPDAGTTGTVPAAQVLQALRMHQVIGVDTKDVREVVVTHAARTLTTKDIEAQIAKALSGRGNLGEASSIAVNLDRSIGALQINASNRGDLNATATRYDQRTGRFDIIFDVLNEAAAPSRIRFSGQAYETVETAVLTRSVDRGEVLKAADITIERRPKAEAGTDLATFERATGMQMRKLVRGGQVLRNTDFGKPDLVQRDQSVSIVYETPGLYLTMRGKATENGAEGDTISVINIGSKRVVQGVVVGPGQVVIAPVALRVTQTASVINPAIAAKQPESKE